MTHLVVATLHVMKSSHASNSNGNAILMLPGDIVMDSTVRMALEALRKYPNETSLYADQLSSDHHGTLTLTGYKGGKLLDQINQDRSFVLIHNPHQQSDVDNIAEPRYILSGVFDGHGLMGHYVAEWSRHVILEKLQHGLASLFSTTGERWGTFERSSSSSSSNVSDEQILEQVKQLVRLTLVDTDERIPDHLAKDGGCTCSMVLQLELPPSRSLLSHHEKQHEQQQEQQQYIFLINAGDSQSFVAATIVEQNHKPDSDNRQQQQLLLSEESIRVIEQTRLDKPDDAMEYRRLIEAGADVHLKTDHDEARVWYTSNGGDGSEMSGLSMSRALGDRGAPGVIAEPVIQVLNVSEWRQQVLRDYNIQQWQQRECSNESSKEAKLFPQTRESFEEEQKCRAVQGDHGAMANYMARKGLDDIKRTVQFFVVSATDGVIDYIKPEEITVTLGRALYGSKKESKHLWLAMQDILLQSAANWHEHMHGEYRDDMAVAVSTVRSPSTIRRIEKSSYN